MTRTIRIAIFVSIVGISLFLYGTFWAPNNFEGDRFIIISKGDNFQQVADSLSRAGIIRSRFLFDITGRLLGSTTKMQIGKYRFRSGVSNTEIVDIIRHGKTIEAITVSIPEGLRATTNAKILSEKLGIDSSRFMDLVNDSIFAESLGVKSKSLIGYLMPQTYKFYWQEAEEIIIKTLVDEFWKEFDERMAAQLKRRGMTLNEILTMASIIELETAIDSERSIIAGVYYNRLQRRMRLQADPTVQFAVGGEPRRLRFSDLEIESAYNTYKHYGLPPGPINNPGKSSILAALYPSRHRYLYFVATGEGGHRFSSSFTEHKRATREYRKIREEKKAANENG